MNIYTKVFIGVAAIVGATGLWMIFSVNPVQALTDRKIYRPGDSLEIAIKNNSGKPVCFSSCYPYFLESQAQNKEWQDYEYGMCTAKNTVAACIAAGATKKFQLSLSETGIGTHRIKVPVCSDCAFGSDFMEDSALYSNVFQIQ